MHLIRSYLRSFAFFFWSLSLRHFAPLREPILTILELSPRHKCLSHNVYVLAR